MIANLEKHKNDLLREIEKLENDVKAGKITKEQADIERVRILADIEKQKRKLLTKKENSQRRRENLN